ncbi:hypothetical protein ACFVUS_17435 [Nocardia sp. NPDC058058]|uniref:hypothetical protein n=1 Tax=Nocardia sp. NPDC058058 TaxID=3346317 RepID=UPI0036DB4782
MAVTAESPVAYPARSLEPPLGVLAAAFAGVFVAGLVISTIRAGGSPFPSPFADAGDALDYFRDQRAAVRTGAVLQYASAIPLTLFVATIAPRLRRHAEGFGPALATLGGALAAVFLFSSGTISWVLTVPEVTADPATVRALHTLAFLVGGPANVLSTGLLIAGIAISALPRKALSPLLIRIGLAIACIALLTTVALTFTAAAFLLPIARFTGMAWLITAGFRLRRA